IMLQLHGTGHVSYVDLHRGFCIELRATCLRPRARDRDRYRSRSRSKSPDYRREHQRSRYNDDEKVRSPSPVRKFTLKKPNFENFIKLTLKPPNFLICSSGTFLAGVDSVA
ncbi:hypothetical protein Tco_0930892, partial [Tanacetum coccineum]